MLKVTFQRRNLRVYGNKFVKNKQKKLYINIHTKQKKTTHIE
jgi:hypothetical protein